MILLCPRPLCQSSKRGFTVSLSLLHSGNEFPKEKLHFWEMQETSRLDGQHVEPALSPALRFTDGRSVLSRARSLRPEREMGRGGRPGASSQRGRGQRRAGPAGRPFGAVYHAARVRGRGKAPRCSSPLLASQPRPRGIGEGTRKGTAGGTQTAAQASAPTPPALSPPRAAQVGARGRICRLCDRRRRDSSPYLVTAVALLSRKAQVAFLSLQQR